jgi:hypothetical protein
MARLRAEDPKGMWAYRTFTSAKHRAKVKNLPFTISMSDILTPDICPVYGTPLIYTNKSGGYRQNSPSLDRIRPHEGYVPGNIATICNRANNMKRDMGPEEIAALLAYCINVPIHKGKSLLHALRAA